MTHRPDRVSVYLQDERVWAELLSRGTYASLVRYSKGGVEYTVYVENDEFIERDVNE